MKRLAVVLSLVALFPACDLFDDDSASGELAFETVAVSGVAVNNPRTEIWRSQEAWESFYCVNSFQAGPICQAPTFDFEAKMLIGVFWGTGFSGCSDETESVETVTLGRDTIEVTIGPLSDLGACTAIVGPYQIISLDSLPHTVVFGGLVPGDTTAGE